MTIEIFIDIETLPTSRKDIQERATADVAPPANYKKPETIQEWWDREGAAKKQEAIAATALDGTWGEVLCIGFAVNDEQVLVVDRAETEADCLDSFWRVLDQHCLRQMTATADWWSHSTFIGHNLQDFDLRFLWQRSRILKVNPGFALPLGKPNYNRGPFVYDTMKEWAGYGKRIKQTDLELAFGIPRDDSITGADVYAKWLAGEMDVIKNHCLQDVENLRAIYRRMVA